MGYREFSTAAMAPHGKPWAKAAMARIWRRWDIENSPRPPWPCHGKPWTRAAIAYIEISMAGHGQPWLRFGPKQEYWIFMLQGAGYSLGQAAHCDGLFCRRNSFSQSRHKPSRLLSNVFFTDLLNHQWQTVSTSTRKMFKVGKVLMNCSLIVIMLYPPCPLLGCRPEPPDVPS